MRPLYSPSTMPLPPAPDPLLLFIRQAQLALVYGTLTRPGAAA
jgi:hypothetical protein